MYIDRRVNQIPSGLGEKEKHRLLEKKEVVGLLLLITAARGLLLGDLKGVPSLWGSNTYVFVHVHA